MTYRWHRVKLKIIFIVVLLALVAGFLVFRSEPDNKQKGDEENQSPATGMQTTTAATIKADDLTYEKPEAWAILAKERLDSMGAITGIGRPPGLSATFTVKVSSSTPTSDNDLKDSTMATLEKLPNFKLLTTSDLKVDGKNGQKFTYISGEKGKEEVKQELNIIVSGQKTFFLLFSSPSTHFDSYAPEFNNILSSIKFVN